MLFRSKTRCPARSRLRVLEGAGHLVFIEEAEEVNGEVASFLLGAEEARVARQGPAAGGKPGGLLRRLPRNARRLASKLGDLLTR